MKENIKRINSISEKRIKFYKKDGDWFYKWSQTYVNAILWEMEEVKEELKESNSVHLEDELWDVLWTYMCLLNSLKDEWKIESVEKVFERSYKKFSWRINEIDWTSNWCWQEIKKIQNLELKKEHSKKFKG